MADILFDLEDSPAMVLCGECGQESLLDDCDALGADEDCCFCANCQAEIKIEVLDQEDRDNATSID